MFVTCTHGNLTTYFHTCDKCELQIASGVLERLMGNDYVKGTTSVVEQVREALMDRKRLREELANSTDDITRLHCQVDSVNEVVKRLRNETPGDILVKSGQDNGPPIPAYRAILSAKSTVLKDMVKMNSSDGCKALSAPDEILTFQELNHEALKIFLDFLYSDNALFFGEKESLRKHATTLLAIAHKYEVSSLKALCEREMLVALNYENALEYLEISDKYNSRELKNAAIDMIKRNKQEVVGSSQFGDFAIMKPHLILELMRALIS